MGRRTQFHHRHRGAPQCLNLTRSTRSKIPRFIGRQGSGHNGPLFDLSRELVRRFGRLFRAEKNDDLSTCEKKRERETQALDSLDSAAHKDEHRNHFPRLNDP